MTPSAAPSLEVVCPDLAALRACIPRLTIPCSVVPAATVAKAGSATIPKYLPEHDGTRSARGAAPGSLVPAAVEEAIPSEEILLEVEGVLFK